LQTPPGNPQKGLRHYVLVTAAYWVFTLSDGALRMLILLELHGRGWTPLELASLFMFYEAAGVVANLAGGWIGARSGLRTTLVAGLGIQFLVLGVLSGPDPWLTLPLLLSAQVASGVAKDLTKMSAKSYVRLVVPAGDPGKLMRWVSLLTGSKNTLKGVGFFLGGWLLVVLGFQGACMALAVGIVAALIMAAIWLPAASGKAPQKISLRHLISSDPRINWLSAARVFLFSSRDAWFVVALPVFLATEMGWSHTQVGAFLAVWVIGYGSIQASAPRWVGGALSAKRAAKPPGGQALIRWTALLLLPLAGLCGALAWDAPPLASLVIGLTVFGAIFATGSAIHSFLIVHYAEGDRVSLRVGFYYAANALGRLAGTLLSGLVYQAAGMGVRGLIACIVTSMALVTLSFFATLPLRRE
jgi:predicted MFS family arabinose efflux permease